jgi:prophage endopeptidase
MNIIPSWRTAVLALVVGIITGGACCWWITSTNYDADIATLKTEHTLALKSVSDEATAASEAARNSEHTFSNK